MRARVWLWLLASAIAAPAGVAAAAGKDKKAARASEDKPRTAPTAREIERYGEGVRRFEAGDYVAAQHLLAPLASVDLKSRDTLLYFLATAEASALPPQRESALGHFHALAAMQDSRFHALARARVADLMFELERFHDAKAAYVEVLASPASEVEPAVARFRLAEIAAREGRKADALAGWRRVFVEQPAHPLSERALARIRAALPAGDPAGIATLSEHIERAKRLVGDHQWQAALDELALVTAEEKKGSPALADEVDYQVGMTHFKMRHGYDIAAEKLLAVWPRLGASRQADTLFHGARAWSRADQDDRAIEGYRQVVAKFPSSKAGREAHFLIGWLEFNRGRFAEALPTLEEVAQHDHSTFSADAAWFAAFSKWMTGDAAGALAGLNEYDRMTTGALGDGKARYWKARALDKLGRRDEAITELRGVAEAWPFSYYAQQARVRLAEYGVTTAPLGDRVLPAASAPGSIDEKVAADSRVARVDELLRAGLAIEAGVELDRVDKALIKQYGAGRVLPLLFDRYAKASDFFHVHRLAEAHAGSALRRDPQKDPAARAWWELVYPLAYRQYVEKYGPTGHNPTYYLYTIMQKESAYNPHDLSYADAIGLLQMIPPTSRRVGVRIGRPYTDDVLYDPEGNVQFGAWYIGHLLEKFKGQVALGAGSFNAGPKAMMKWIKLNGARPLDEFVELCPYTQTREYMKKALEIYARYLWLYQGRDYMPDEKIDPAWLDDGIDY